MGLPVSTYPSIVDVLVRCQRNLFFSSAQIRLKHFKINSLNVIAITLSDDSFDGMIFGTDVGIDEGYVSILGVKCGIFQHKET